MIGVLSEEEEDLVLAIADSYRRGNPPMDALAQSSWSTEGFLGYLCLCIAKVARGE